MNTLATYLNSLPSKIYTREEEKALFEQYYASEDEEVKKDIRDNIINHNLRYVVDVAKKMARDVDTLMEFISCGNMGLMEAFEHYDLAAGCGFTTYADHWIKLEIRKQMKDFKPIAIPQHIEEQIIQIESIKNGMLQILHREPTPEEISIAYGGVLEVETIESVIVQSENIYKAPISLDTPLAVESDDDGTKSLYYDIEDTAGCENDLDNKLIAEALRDALEELKPEEKEIIVWRFYDNMTRKEIQEKLEQRGRKLSTERIRQIESNVLKKMSNNAKIRELKGGK
jgi:RNA polymerase primary sigma factor